MSERISWCAQAHAREALERMHAARQTAGGLLHLPGYCPTPVMLVPAREALVFQKQNDMPQSNSSEAIRLCPTSPKGRAHTPFTPRSRRRRTAHKDLQKAKQQVL
ncbi:hypothetical protein NDU88_002487 [Pleurodeles waltl]|uniref:Uncharacterized protein n=1 Tax=Pleurodeles waltl TaxID=8319 RepID=A0AAV7MRK5_PLEWA|nr:hypothetical protein NDU88_002487 [Pleurodeles waltl]